MVGVSLTATRMVYDGSSSDGSAKTLRTPDTSLAVVLLPGLGANALAFLPVFVAAVGAAANAAWVLAVTYATPFGPTLADTARQVWQALAAATSPATAPALAGITRVLLVGYSMGGMVAAHMVAGQPLNSSTARCPALAGVVYLSTGTPANDALPVPTGELMQAAMRGRGTPGGGPGGPGGPDGPDGPTAAAVRGSARLRTMFPGPWLRAAPRATVLDMTAALASGKVEPATRAAQLSTIALYLLGGGPGRFPAGSSSMGTVPALVLHGAHDRILKFSAAQKAAAATPGATFVRFPHAGHGLPYQDPEGVAAAVGAWWRQVGDNAAITGGTVSSNPAISTAFVPSGGAVLYLPPALSSIVYCTDG
jgi:pimeloyl-ACP methyl ester carboxylesterase